MLVRALYLIPQKQLHLIKTNKTSSQFSLKFCARLAAALPERSVIAENKDEHPASQGMRINQRGVAYYSVSSPWLTSKPHKQSPKNKAHQRFHLLILPKPLVFLLGSIMPLFAQNLSTPLLMTFPRFLTLSSSTGDVSTFSKPFAETPLKLFTIYTTKISKPSIKKQSIPPIYCEF